MAKPQRKHPGLIVGLLVFVLLSLLAVQGSKLEKKLDDRIPPQLASWFQKLMIEHSAEADEPVLYCLYVNHKVEGLSCVSTQFEAFDGDWSCVTEDLNLAYDTLLNAYLDTLSQERIVKITLGVRDWKEQGRIVTMPWRIDAGDGSTPTTGIFKAEFLEETETWKAL